MDTSSNVHSSEVRGASSIDGRPRFSLAIGVGVWAAALGISAAASAYVRPPGAVPASAIRAAFDAAMVAIYLGIFCHCLMRLAHLRCPSWMLFTAGFGGLTFASALGLVVETGLVRDTAASGQVTLLRAAMLPTAAALLVFATHAAKERMRGRPVGSWKYYAKVVVLSALVLVAWRCGAYGILDNIVTATASELRLAVDVAFGALLCVLLYRALRLAVSKHEEIILPVSYWAAAMLIGTIASLVTLGMDRQAWWQTHGLEIAGSVALLIGLSLGNERAHRYAAEKMADLQAMEYVSWSLVGASNLGELSDALARAISEGVHAETVVVYLTGENDGELVITARHGIDDPSVAVGKVCSLKPDRRPGFHNGHTARAYAGGEVEVVEEIFSDVEFMPWRAVAHSEGAVVSVPLQYQGRAIGVLNLFLAGARSVGANKVALLEAIAAAVSPAIENARMRSVSHPEAQQAA